VTPYYGAPQWVAEQIASLPELKYRWTIIRPVKVKVLGPDTGMRTFTAQLDGTFMGKPIPSHVFVTIWREMTGCGANDSTKSRRCGTRASPERDRSGRVKACRIAG